jgi:hypothetical protein
VDLSFLIQSSFQSVDTILKELLLIIQFSLDVLVNFHVLHGLILDVLFVEVIVH